MCQLTADVFLCQISTGAVYYAVQAQAEQAELLLVVRTHKKVESCQNLEHKEHLIQSYLVKYRFGMMM